MSGDPLHHDPAYFRSMYSTDDDPWGFEDRWYEQRKQAVTLAILPRPTYAVGFEPGCANGALTVRLQARCRRLVACELVPEVARRAAARLAGHSHVEVGCGAFPDWWPPVPAIDLLVLSEVAYYLTAAGQGRARAAIERSLAPGGDIVAVHYTGETDYPMRGVEVAAWLDGFADLERLVTHVEPAFEAGVWRRRGATPHEEPIGQPSSRS